jgi:hypothetical protein
MATHDYVIANGTGAAVRSDLNNALAAIVSNNSGSSEPGTTYAYQWWADTNANVLKLRNSSNDGWITLRELDGTMLMENGSVSAPGLAFASDLDTGFFRIDPNDLGIATGGVQRLRLSPSEAVFNENSVDYDFRVESNGNTHMLFVDAGNDRIGIGTSSPSHLVDARTASGNAQINLRSGGDLAQLLLISNDTSGQSQINFGDNDANNIGIIQYAHSDNSLRFTVNSSERARLDSSGRLLAGTSTSPSAGNGQYARIFIQGYTGGNTGAGYFAIARGQAATAPFSSNTEIGHVTFTDSTGASFASVTCRADGATGTDDYPGRLQFETTADGASSPTERMRINSSGNLLLGHTSPADSSNRLEVENSIGARIGLLRDDTSVTDGNNIGQVTFYGNDSSGVYHTIGQIEVAADGEHSTGSKPTRMIFYTTPSGDNSANEVARINSSGNFLVGQTNASFGTAGHILGPNGQAYHICSGDSPLLVNRQSNDGELVRLAQDGATEGNITVSGSSVSYNGGHLSRWSQLAGGAERAEILRGSVLSNLDEMCEWAYEAQDAVLYTEEDELPEGVSVGDVKTPAIAAGTEDNEQLNRMKVSDVEGDVNVSGVFQAWDDDDDTYTNDFYCAMTGDFVIRIAQGTTVARGDLLMSAGDGTAKPQDDGIVRSKTIAKVTSTTVSTTYSDGSYCVPCVLMAC